MTYRRQTIYRCQVKLEREAGPQVCSCDGQGMASDGDDMRLCVLCRALVSTIDSSTRYKADDDTKRGPRFRSRLHREASRKFYDWLTVSETVQIG